MPVAENIREQSAENFVPVEISGRADSLYESYLDKKAFLRRLLRENQETEKILDRHKIAACLCSTIIDNRIMVHPEWDEPEGTKHDPHKTLRTNERFAFEVGIAVLSAYMAEENETNRDCIVKLRQCLENGFDYPETNYSNSYIDSAVRGLYYSNLAYGVSPVLLANIFFLLEQYFYLKNGLDVKPRKKLEE
jgi:hypothetical protein